MNEPKIFLAQKKPVRKLVNQQKKFVSGVENKFQKMINYIHINF